MLHILGFLIIGGIIGLLAGLIVRGHGFGIIGDIIVGVVGSLVGGYAWQLLFPSQDLGKFGSLVVSLICAVVLVALLKLVVGRRSAATSP
jgi:uncharacterized membrane protein YeaQ/YmgE (transglycosylase-associated protein family)